MYDLTDQPVLSGLEEIEHYRAIAAWEKATHTGDRAELAALPEASALWHKLDARADTCIGQKCSAWDKCFITEMHRRAMESDIIIVNHHLFFADLAIKQQAEDAPDAGILPEVGAVIFDEAHELEDVAGSYFGISVSNMRVEELCRDVEISSATEQFAFACAVGRSEEPAGACGIFLFRACRRGKDGLPLRTGGNFWKRTATSFWPCSKHCSGSEQNWKGCRRSRRRSTTFRGGRQELQVQLGFLMESEDRNTVFWIERRNTRGRRGNWTCVGECFSSGHAD